jgi:secondary thiamine-phosphate synthase enzyme
MFSSEINVRSTREVEFIDITSKVQEAVSASGVKEGVCLVYVPHTTAGVTINENADPSVVVDIINKLSELVPQSSSYRHTEGNAPAHIKSTLVGCSVLIPVSGGKLMLGTWQGVFFCEFDGPRQRRVIIRIF